MAHTIRNRLAHFSMWADRLASLDVRDNVSHNLQHEIFARLDHWFELRASAEHHQEPSLPAHEERMARGLQQAERCGYVFHVRYRHMVRLERLLRRQTR